ncbi:hypothetical protein ACKKBF_B39420 [Auxenochlorella protothecoides x Auxenochlorella symbiontica]
MDEEPKGLNCSLDSLIEESGGGRAPRNQRKDRRGGDHKPYQRRGNNDQRLRHQVSGGPQIAMAIPHFAQLQPQFLIPQAFPHAIVHQGLEGPHRPRGPRNRSQEPARPSVDPYAYRKKQTCFRDEETGNVVFRYDTVDLVVITPAGEVTLDSQDAADLHVFRSLNDALAPLNMRVTAPSGRWDIGDWSVSDGRALLRFQDGMKLPPKGPAAASRAQLMLDGFKKVGKVGPPGRTPGSGQRGGYPQPPHPFYIPGGAPYPPPPQAPKVALPGSAAPDVFSRLGGKLETGISEGERRLLAQGRLG